MLIELLAALAWSAETVVSLDGQVWADLRAAGEHVEAQSAEARRAPSPWVSHRDVVVTDLGDGLVGSSRVDLQACKLEYSIVSPK